MRIDKRVSEMEMLGINCNVPNFRVELNFDSTQETTEKHQTRSFTHSLTYKYPRMKKKWKYESISKTQPTTYNTAVSVVVNLLIYMLSILCEA